MAEGRPPEDLQEAVAATLRRLRGEVGAARPAARVEPQFMAPAAEEPSPPPADAQDTESPPAAEPDRPSPIVAQTDIPPAPSSYEPSAEAPAIEVAERRAPTSHDGADAAEAAAPPRRHWLRYVLALGVLVVFAGVGWWAYSHFAGRTGNGEIPVIAADQTPEKVPPADQPANETQDEPETVYNQISPGGGNTQQPEVLLPQPEQPASPPAASPANGASAAAPAGSSNAAAGSETAATDAGSGSAAAGASSPAPVAPAAGDGSSSEGNTTLTETLLPPSATASNPPPAAGASQGTASLAPAIPPAAPAAPPTTQTQAGTQTATTAPSVPAATGTTENGQADNGAAAASSPAPANDAPTSAGNYRVQLAALKTEADARTAWKRMAAKYPDILGALTLHLEKADLGTKGIYYRVQAGAFTDKTAARALCEKLKAKGQQCLVKP